VVFVIGYTAGAIAFARDTVPSDTTGAMVFAARNVRSGVTWIGVTGSGAVSFLVAPITVTGADCPPVIDICESEEGVTGVIVFAADMVGLTAMPVGAELVSFLVTEIGVIAMSQSKL
jgi:hypothetical protein